MDHILSRESDFVVDLETCRSTSGEAGSTNSPLDVEAGDAIFTSVCNGDGEEPSKTENGLNMNSNIKDGDELTRGSVRVFIDKANLVDKKTSKEKRKSTSAKKPPKPPRPPRGLSLDAADQKLIKEIAELAMIKRARIERMKALKKMKVAKASSTSSALNGSSLALLLFSSFLCYCFKEDSNLSTSTAILKGSGSSDKVEQASGLTHGNSPESVAS